MDELETTFFVDHNHGFVPLFGEGKADPASAYGAVHDILDHHLLGFPRNIEGECAAFGAHKYRFGPISLSELLRLTRDKEAETSALLTSYRNTLGRKDRRSLWAGKDALKVAKYAWYEHGYSMAKDYFCRFHIPRRALIGFSYSLLEILNEAPSSTTVTVTTSISSRRISCRIA